MIRLAAFIALAAWSTQFCRAALPTTAPSAFDLQTVNRDLPDYERIPTLGGKIFSVGSPTTNALISAWIEEFKKVYPSVEFDLKGGNSVAVLPAFLSKNPPNLGSMSRPMSDDEIAQFRKRFGYPPTAIRVAVNAVAIFVSAENPCHGLSLAQLDGIYSRTHKTGQEAILTWGDAGLRDDSWKDERILPYVQDETRGVSGLMKSRVMLGGDFRYDAQTELTASAIVEDAAVDRGAIGYASIIFRTRRARALPIQGTDGSFYAPTYENCLSQKYPLADFLYIYINRPPNRPLDRPTREFLTFACWQLGQEIAAREGGFPLTPELAREQLDLIGK
jgi:phosphate transport system substrate-binding protein